MLKYSLIIYYLNLNVMGYYTNYEIIAIEDPNEEFDDFLWDLADYTDIHELNHGYATCVTWYNCQEDSIEISKRYPDILFRIEGDGEASDDIWRFYCQNGKSKYVEMVWPEFMKEDLE